MKVWVEYYNGANPAVGDRSVVRLDGRNSLTTWVEDGHAFNGVRRPYYDGFKIIRGTSLLGTTEITNYIPGRKKK